MKAKPIFMCGVLVLFGVLVCSALVQAGKKSSKSSSKSGASRAEERMTLKIRNGTPFIISIYVAGIRAGWIKPFRTEQFRGLKVGSHKLYAFSEYGTTSWGPASINVPGIWNLTVDPGAEPADLDTALASRIYRANKNSLVACDTLAERRGETVKGSRPEFNIKVSDTGEGVVEVTAADLGEKLLSCYRIVSKQWKFPNTGAAYQIAFQHVP